MIIDTEEHTLTVKLAHKMLAALRHFDGVNDNTEIKFNYYKGSGWTVSVVDKDEAEYDDEPPLTPLPNISPMQPGIVTTPHWVHNAVLK